MKILNVEHGLNFSSFLICSCILNRKVVVNVSTAFLVSILIRGCVLERLRPLCTVDVTRCVHAAFFI